MLCIDNRCTDVHFNLAAEEYLLKQKRGNYLMLWQSEPSVVIGKNQSVTAETDEEFLQDKGIVLARRFSGGGAVYHDQGNINLSFIETVRQPDFDSYLQQVVDFLERVGVAAYADRRLGIYVDERKVSGSAQCIYKDRVMYHCTLLFSTDLAVLQAALNGAGVGEKRLPGSAVLRAVASVRSEVVNLQELLTESMDIRRFMRLLFHYFVDDDDNGIYRFSAGDVEAIERLKTERYARREWIYNKTEVGVS